MLLASATAPSGRRGVVSVFEESLVSSCGLSVDRGVGKGWVDSPGIGPDPLASDCVCLGRLWGGVVNLGLGGLLGSFGCSAGGCSPFAGCCSDAVGLSPLEGVAMACINRCMTTIAPTVATHARRNARYCSKAVFMPIEGDGQVSVVMYIRAKIREHDECIVHVRVSSLYTCSKDRLVAGG